MRTSLESDSHSTCSTANQRKRGLARFSLRRLLYASPLVTRRVGKSASRHSKSSPSSQVDADAATATAAATAARVAEAAAVAAQEDLQKAGSRASVFDAGKSGFTGTAECPLCLGEMPVEYFPELSTCTHRSCYDCFQQYLRMEISESRVGVACPECSEPMHPNDIRMVLNDTAQYEKYEDFMVRRVLAVEPDTRWCPAPDCTFAVIASGCASCPKIKCERPGCDAYFCYHCKAEWHANQTCDAARALRNMRSSSVSFSQDSQHRDDIKPCPRCQVLIVKMDDGSCNHMTCAVCGAEFCWLCMKEISDLHYLSPSGCTFWGKKPWSRKKKILWQLGTLVGAPVGIGLVAGIAVPAMMIGIPVWVGRKLYTRYEHANKHKRNLAIAGGVTASVLVSPVLAGLAVSIGVPILLFYVYGVVPVSLCRSGGCGVSTSGTRVRFDFDDENDLLGVLGTRGTGGDAVSMDAVSHRGGNPSIGEVSLSLGSGSQLERLGREIDRESASNVAIAGASLAGSIASSMQPGGQRLEVQVDVASTQRFSMSSETASAATSLSEKSVSASMADDGAASMRALAGSMLNYKMDAAAAAPADSTQSVEVHADSASQRSDEAGINSLDELMLRRSRKRPPLDRQTSDSGSWTTGGEDGVSERVRFDNHVSYITPHSYDPAEEGCSKEAGRGRWGWGSDARGHSSDSDGADTKARLNKCASIECCTHDDGNDGSSTSKAESTFIDMTAKAGTHVAAGCSNASPKTSAVATLRSVFFHSSRTAAEVPRSAVDAEVPRTLPAIAEPVPGSQPSDLQVIVDVPVFHN